MDQGRPPSEKRSLDTGRVAAVLWYHWIIRTSSQVDQLVLLQDIIQYYGKVTMQSVLEMRNTAHLLEVSSLILISKLMRLIEFKQVGFPYSVHSVVSLQYSFIVETVETLKDILCCLTVEVSNINTINELRIHLLPSRSTIIPCVLPRPLYIITRMVSKQTSVGKADQSVTAN